MVLRRGLRRARVTVPEVNIWEEPAGAAVVREITSGNETVPTLVVGDWSLVNPSTRSAVEAIRAYAPELIGPVPERGFRRWQRRR
jgi:mycoredoxin